MMRKTYNMVSKRVMGVLTSITLLLSLTMCETDYCNENMYVVGTLRAFHKVSKSQINVFLATMDANGDTINYIGNTSGSYANFSLNPESDTSRFYILTPDTIEIGKIVSISAPIPKYGNVSMYNDLVLDIQVDVDGKVTNF